MKRFRMFVVEDNIEQEEIFRRNISIYQNQVDIDNLVVATSFEDANSILASGQKFDVSILDIYLDEGTCYELLNSHDIKQFGQLVFNTKEQLVLENLKGLKITGGFYTLDEKYTPASLSKLFKELSNNTKSVYKEKLLIPNATGKQIVEADNILFIEVAGKSSHIHFRIDGITNMLTEEKSLSKYEDILDPNKFYRIHNNYFVNREYIYEVQLYNVLMKFEFKLSENTHKTKSLPIAERRRVGFMKFMDL